MMVVRADFCSRFAVRSVRSDATPLAPPTGRRLQERIHETA